MKRFAVIASNSFSGGHFVDHLLSQADHEVIGLSRSPEKSPLFLPYKGREQGRFRFYQLDINTQLDQMMKVLDDFQPEYVVNFAAQGEVGSSWKYPHHWYQTNAVGIVQFSDALRTRPYLKKYAHISTPEVYGTCEGRVDERTPLNPTTPYAASKASGDLFLQTLVKQYQFPLITIRSTNVYGKHQQLYRIIPRTAIYLKMGKTIQLHGGGKAIKSYIHIQDVCDGIYKATLDGKGGEVYHLSDDHEIAIRDLVTMVCKKMGYDFLSSTEEVAERPGQDARYYIDSSKARTTLSWVPTRAMDQGVDEMIDWIQSNWGQIQNEPLDYIHIPS